MKPTEYADENGEKNPRLYGPTSNKEESLY
jgi:hypothetical protein